MSNRLVVKDSPPIDRGQMYLSSLPTQEFFILIGFWINSPDPCGPLGHKDRKLPAGSWQLASGRRAFIYFIDNFYCLLRSASCLGITHRPFCTYFEVPESQNQ